MLAALLSAGLAGTACGSGPGPAASPPSTTVVYGEGDLRNISCSPTTGIQKMCGGLLPAPRGVTDRIDLDRSVVPTGTAIDGWLVVENETGRSIALRDPHGCEPSFAVALTNATVAPEVVFSTVCLNRPLVLSTGETRLPIEVTTTYSACSPRTTATSSSRSLPECLPHGGQPDLPVGGYYAVLVGLGLALPPVSAPVRLTEHK